MPKLQKNKDIFLFKTGATEPTGADGFLTDGNVTFSQSPVTYATNLTGEGKGNTTDDIAVKENVPSTLNVPLVLMEPTDIAGGLPQFPLLAAAGFKQEIDTGNNKITIYPSLEGVNGTGALYRGGTMKYIIEQVLTNFALNASAADTKVGVTLDMVGTFNPASVANATITPTFVKNSHFAMTSQSKVTVNGEAKCPFGDISLTLNSQINTGDDSRVCTEIVLEDIAPMLSFSEVLNTDGDSNLAPIANWLNDSNVVISFPLFSKNYKMELKINAGKEKSTEDGESGLKILQRRNIRLMNDSNGRAFEIVVTPK